MDHEVFVPVPAETVREALRDPARLARCVPGLQQDADESAGPLSGRLKVRIGSTSITYRGALRMVERDGTFEIEGEGAETRGSGTVKVALTIAVAPAPGGATLHFTGTAAAVGRLAELAPSSTATAARKLLSRCASRLAASPSVPETATGAPAAEALGDEGPGPVSVGDAESLGLTEPEPADDAPAAGARAAEGVEDLPAGESEAGDGSSGAAASEPADDASGAAAPVSEAGDDGGTPSAFEAPGPAPSPGEDADEEFRDLDGDDFHDDFTDEPPAEAAHARRTMIGRSAEEVDHAPPRGRYAPTPAPDAGGAGLTLRWIAPAAALAIASAVVVGRALRRRR